MSKRLEKKIEKIEKKIKLNELEIKKFSTDLEIKISELEENFKNIDQEFPNLKEKIEEIEDLMNIINLGLVDFRDKIERFESRLSELEKVHGNTEKRIEEFQTSMDKLKEFIENASTQAKRIEDLKEDLSKSLEEKISLNLESLKGEIDTNKNRIEDLLKKLDYLSLAISSFERTVKIMNLDELARRFDGIDKRIMAFQTEIDKLRISLETASVAKGDLEILKERIKDIGSTLLQTMNRMNEFELGINKKLAGWDRMQGLIRELSELEKLKEDLMKLKQSANQ